MSGVSGVSQAQSQLMAQLLAAAVQSAVQPAVDMVALNLQLRVAGGSPPGVGENIDVSA